MKNICEKTYSNIIEWVCCVVFILPLCVAFLAKYGLVAINKIVEVLQVIVVEIIEAIRRMYQKSIRVLSVKD